MNIKCIILFTFQIALNYKDSVELKNHLNC